MKKIYIIPQMETVQMNTELLIAESIGKGENTITSDTQILVKKDQPSTNSYNVWDEDWSK